MGIKKQARDQFAADVAAFKVSATPTRDQLRAYVAAIVDAGNEWLRKRAASDTTALAGFAVSKQAQFNTFLDGVADPVLDPIDPTT